MSKNWQIWCVLRTMIGIIGSLATLSLATACHPASGFPSHQRPCSHGDNSPIDKRQVPPTTRLGLWHAAEAQPDPDFTLSELRSVRVVGGDAEFQRRLLSTRRNCRVKASAPPVIDIGACDELAHEIVRAVMEYGRSAASSQIDHQECRRRTNDTLLCRPESPDLALRYLDHTLSGRPLGQWQFRTADGWLRPVEGLVVVRLVRQHLIDV